MNLKHGFFAKGEIYPSEEKECFSLPIDAIQEGIGKMVVFYSVSEDGKVAIKQETNIVTMNSEKVFIKTDDFHDDMMIIVEKQKELKHLDKIKIIESELFAAAN